MQKHMYINISIFIDAYVISYNYIQSIFLCIDGPWPFFPFALAQNPLLWHDIRWSFRGDPWFQEAILKLQHEKDARERADRPADRPDPVTGSWFRWKLFHGSVEICETMWNGVKWNDEMKYVFSRMCWAACWVYAILKHNSCTIIYMQLSHLSNQGWIFSFAGTFRAGTGSATENSSTLWLRCYKGRWCWEHHLGVRHQMKGRLHCFVVFEFSSWIFQRAMPADTRWYHLIYMWALPRHHVHPCAACWQEGVGEAWRHYPGNSCTFVDSFQVKWRFLLRILCRGNDPPLFRISDGSQHCRPLRCNQ